MPIYSYFCVRCPNEFEILATHRFPDYPCPICGCQADAVYKPFYISISAELPKWDRKDIRAIEDEKARNRKDGVAQITKRLKHEVKQEARNRLKNWDNDAVKKELIQAKKAGHFEMGRSG